MMVNRATERRGRDTFEWIVQYNGRYCLKILALFISYARQNPETYMNVDWHSAYIGINFD